MSEKESNVRPWKAKSLMLHGKGFFRGEGKHWSSEVAWALVLYIPEEDDIRIRRKWPQRAKDGNKAWVQPVFSKKTRKRFKTFARGAYLRKYKRSGAAGGDDNEEELKGHCQELCKRCEELGHRCTQRKNRVRQQRA